VVQKQGTIPKSFIQDLLARSDIVQVVNQRVPLKKAGSTYKACCPFHSEKTPSFNVNPQKQFYHCFGCGASGDALKFMMEYDGLSFVEAVETLATQNGMEVPREKLSPQAAAKRAQKQQKEKTLYDVLYLVTRFYRQMLRDHAQSEQAKTYLKARGLTAEIAKEFVIGFAPPGWQNLEVGLKNEQDVKMRQYLIDAGMLIQKEEGSVYDRFRNRIMFPIRDGRGRVIAFGGRTMGDDQPKYLNSPETDVFHKSQTLYGLYEMRQARQQYDYVIVVEGYMDVVSLAQFEVKNAVATLGTAITAQHLDILFREVSQIVFCFDGDSAGLKAAWKALELALPNYSGERLIKFLFLETGEDPDSTVRKEGREGFERRVQNAMLMSDFLFQKLKGDLSVGLESSEGRQQLIAKVQPYIAQAQPGFQDALTEDLSQLVGLPVWRLGQIMGIRVSSTKRFEKALVEAKPVSKVTHSVLRLIAILLKRPIWAQYFDTQLLNDLGHSEVDEYRFLSWIIAHLKEHEYLKEALVDFLSEGAKQRVLVQAQALPMQDADDFLSPEFIEIMEQLTKDLDEEKALSKVNQSDEALQNWFQQQKKHKNNKE